MRKYLVFYPVENELKIERHTFDLMTDEEAWEELCKVEGVRIYDLTRSNRNGSMLDMGDFVEDYNDEELDGGWWSVILTLPDEQEEGWEYPQELLKVGTKCKWNDPAIDDYPKKDRKKLLNRVFTVEQINGEVILISDDEGTEAEVFACELELLD